MTMAFVFPGQGSQYVGMGKMLTEKYPIAREIFDLADETLGYSISEICFQGPEEELNKTVYTQPALFTFSMALYGVLKEKGFLPQFVAGHSLGEYSALAATEAISLIDGIKLVDKRAHLMQKAYPMGEGLMAAVLGLNRDTIEEVCWKASAEGVVEPANINCPGQIVISGQKAAVEKAVSLAKEAGAKRGVILSVSIPSHCSLMAEAGEELRNLLEETNFVQPKIPIVFNSTAGFIDKPAGIRDALVKQLSQPVLWEDSIRNLIGQGCRTFLEVGPGKVLAGLNKKIDREILTYNINEQNLEKSFANLKEVL